jgi:hypothetical protein
MSMRKANPRSLPVVARILLFLLLAGLVYGIQRSRFLQRANSGFDPQERAFTGVFVPWPLGRPTLVGRLDPLTDR